MPFNLDVELLLQCLLHHVNGSQPTLLLEHVSYLQLQIGIRHLFFFCIVLKKFWVVYFLPIPLQYISNAGTASACLEGNQIEVFIALLTFEDYVISLHKSYFLGYLSKEANII